MLVDGDDHGDVEEKWKQTTCCNDTKNTGSSQSWELATIGDSESHPQNFDSYSLETCEAILEAQQSKAQIRFRSSVGFDDAFAVFDNVCSRSVPMWCASLGLRKALDRIESSALFDALKVQGVHMHIWNLSCHCIMIRLDAYKGNNFQPNAVWNKETLQASIEWQWALNTLWKMEVACSTLQTSLWWWWGVNKRALCCMQEATLILQVWWGAWLRNWQLLV